MLCGRYSYYPYLTKKKRGRENGCKVATPGWEPRKCGPGAHVSNACRALDALTVFTFRLNSAHP